MTNRQIRFSVFEVKLLAAIAISDGLIRAERVIRILNDFKRQNGLAKNEGVERENSKRSKVQAS